jgi:hypothetical protein
MNLSNYFGERRPQNSMRRRHPVRARLRLEALEPRALLSGGLRLSGFVDEILAAAANGTLGEGDIKNPPSPIGTTPTSTDPNVNTDCEGVPGPHNETTIAVNPTNPLNMIGSANDYQERISRGGQVNETQYSRAHVTFDGGQTWSEYAIQLNSYQATGDPAVAFDADGTAYLTTLGVQWAGPGTGVNADIVASHSTDGGQTWSKPTRVAQGTGSYGSPGTFNDKEYIAAWGHGNAIVTWTVFNQGNKGSVINHPIYASVTHDGGKTWSKGVQISGNLDYDQFSVPVVATDGSIYVAFESFDLHLNDTGRDQYFVVKVDPTTGERVGDPYLVADLVDGYTDYPINIDGEQTYQDSQFRTTSLGNITADPTNALHLAVIWSDMRNSTVPAPADPYSAVTNSDIVVSQSFDGGQTWSSPTAITLRGDQFMPWGAYTASGKLQIGFFDRSYDPANHLYGYTLASETAPGALSFTNLQMTTTLSDPTQGDRWFGGRTPNPAFPHPSTFVGDYSGIAVTPSGGIAALWTDMRNSVTYRGRTGSGEDAYFGLVTPPAGAAPALAAVTPSALSLSTGGPENSPVPSGLARPIEPALTGDQVVHSTRLSASGSTPTVAQQLSPDGVAPAAPPHFWHRRSILRAARGIRGAAHFGLTGLPVDLGANATRVASEVRHRKSLGFWN